MTDRTVRALEFVLFGALACWLAWCAWWVAIEYYDGLDSVANARLFAGFGNHYVVSRGPLLSLLLVPAEWASRTLALAPLDLRLHHATMALLHLAYLAFCYRVVRRVAPTRVVALLAFAMAVPTFLFFSYAPFISHDLFPGALLLAMLVLADRFDREGGHDRWLAMVALGAASALVKHTFALFWLLVLVARAVAFWLGRGESDDWKRVHGMRLATLCAGAVLSGAVVWLVLGLALRATWPDQSLLWLPLAQIRHMAGQYDAGQYATFPWWVYLRNVPAYGAAALALVIPGIAMSLRGTSFQRSVAIAWVVAFAAMHVLAAREVRYLAFLAPLTAILIVPAVSWSLRRPALAAAALAVFAIDVSRAGGEALRIRAPFYTAGVAEQLLEPIQERAGEPVLINWKLLSFVAPGREPFPGDRYHRVFHVGPHHLGIFYGLTADDFRLITRPEHVALAAWPNGTWLVWSSGLVLNAPGQPRAQSLSSVSRIETIALRPTAAGYESDDGLTLHIDRSGEALRIRGEGLAERLRDVRVLRLLTAREQAEYPLSEIDGGLAIVGLDHEPAPDARLEIRGFRIERRHPPPS